jgi:hypothetical protein
MPAGDRRHRGCQRDRRPAAEEQVPQQRTQFSHASLRRADAAPAALGKQECAHLGTAQSTDISPIGALNKQAARGAFVADDHRLRQPAIAHQPRPIGTDQFLQRTGRCRLLQRSRTNLDQMLAQHHQAVPKDNLPDTGTAALRNERIDLRATQLINGQAAGRHPPTEVPHHSYLIANRAGRISKRQQPLPVPIHTRCQLAIPPPST